MGFWDSVSDGLDWLSRGIETFGQDTVQATKEFSQIQKLKSEIQKANRTINTQYLRLGKRFYEEHKDDPEMEQDPMLRSITENSERIAACEQEIVRLRESSKNLKEESDAAQAAQDVAAQDEADRRTFRGNSPEVRAANAEDDIVDYQPVEPADDSDFVEEEEPQNS